MNSNKDTKTYTKTDTKTDTETNSVVDKIVQLNNNILSNNYFRTLMIF